MMNSFLFVACECRRINTKFHPSLALPVLPIIAMSSDAATVAAVLAVLLPAGGFVGYARKGSIPSAIAGSVVGALYAFAWSQLKSSAPVTPQFRQGLLTATAASAVLGVAMLVRLIRTKKALPLILTVVGSGSTYYFASQL